MNTGEYRYLSPPGAGNPCINEIAIHAGVLAIAADDGRLRLARWEQNRLRLDATVTPPVGRVLSNAVDIRDDVVVLGNHHHELLWFSVNGVHAVMRAEIAVNEGPINSVKILPSTGLVAAGTYEGAIAVVAPDGIFSVIELGRGAVKAMALVDDWTLAVGTASGAVGRVDLETREATWFGGHEEIVNDVAVGADGRSLASVGRDFMLRLTDLWTGTTTATIPLVKRSPKAVVHGAPGTVHVADYWGWISAVDIATGVAVSERKAINGISSLATSGRTLLAGSYDGSVTALDGSTLATVDRLALMHQRDPASTIAGS